jgi:hypothetical protein
MAIDIIPKRQEEESDSILNILSIISYSFLILCMVGSVVFFLGTRSMHESIKTLDENIAKAKSEGDLLTLERRINSYKSRIEDIGGLFLNRPEIWMAFSYIGSITHPEVYYSSFSMNSEERKVSLPGTASSLTSFEQQRYIIRDETEGGTVSNFSLGADGTVTFTASFTIPHNIIFPTINNNE